MNITKSMISIVAASLLIASFTGCSEGSTTTSSSTAVNSIEKNTYTAPVKGLVIDDAGNPVQGAVVYIGSKWAKTNDGGQYQINGVDVSSYLTNQTGEVSVVGSQSDAHEQLLSVSIVPPSNSGLTSAVVQVNPEMVHIENIGEDQLSEGVATTTTTGAVYTQPNSQSFTLMSEAGTAMLSYKTAKVTGIVRDVTTGDIIPDTTIVVSYTGVSQESAWAVNNNIITGVNSIISKTDENGSFLLEKLLTSSNYEFIIEGYTNVGVTGDGINTGASALYADGDYITNTANVFVTKILSDDTISPYIDLQSNSELTPYLANIHPTDAPETMVIFAEGIDGTAGNEFLINFTEVIDTTKLVDESVIVYDRTNSTEIAATVAFINNGQTLQLTTASVAEDTVLEFRLRRSDFTDAQGNILHTTNGVIDTGAGPTDSNINGEIQAALSNQFIVLNASTYKQVSMSLATVVSSGQNAGTAEDLTNNSYANAALNTVSDYVNGTTNVLNQMNAADAVGADLTLLATALDGTINTVNTNVATITFTADPNVTTYWARVVDADGVDIAGARITQVSGSDTGAGAGDAIAPTTALATNNPLLTAAAGANASELKDVDSIVTTFLVDLNQDLTEGDSVEIYPVNDFGDTGTATVVVLTDNTPLTTVINSDLVAGSSTVDFVAAGAPSSFGGDLIDFSDASGTALPYLFVRADMYKATDDALQTDQTLQDELTGGDNIYDAADFTTFLSTIPRTVAIQISEPVAPSTTLVTALKVYDNANSEVTSVITAAQSGTAGTKEVIGATINNIFNLQDYNTISLAGIADAAGNVAGAQAGVKLYDALPPLMTASIVNDNSISFTFTEDISLTQTGAGIAGFITLTGGASVYTFSTDANGVMTVSRNTTHTDFNNQSVISNTALETTTTNVSGVLTVTLTGNDSTGTATDVGLSTYFSDVHGTKDATGTDNAIATGSSEATFTKVPDTSTSAAGIAGTNNSWANASDNLTIAPKFAVADSVAPRLTTAIAPINPNASATDLQFVHAIDVTNASLFNIAGAGTNADNDWVVGETGDTYTLELNFREDISDGTDFFSGSVTATASPANYAITSVTPVGNTGLQLVFASSGTTAGSDKITISGVEDASGNATSVTITLEGLNNGITVNADAIK